MADSGISLSAELQPSAAPSSSNFPALLIGGMHRSGTSAFTRVLSLLGAGLPKTLMPPGEDNSQGFWESATIAAVNDTILQEVGSSWDDIFAFLQRPEAAATRLSAIAKIENVVKAEFEVPGFPVIKDPRISIMAPLWERALQHLGAAPAAIVLVRNPLEVAASLQKRNNFPKEKSLLLYLCYHLAFERDTRHLPRSFVAYDDFLRDWRATLARVEAATGLTFPGRTPAAELAIDRFLSREFRHHHFDVTDLAERDYLSSWSRRVFGWLKEASQGLSPPDHSRLDLICDEMKAASQVYAAVIVDLSQQLSATKLSLAEEREAKERERAQAAETLSTAIDTHALRERGHVLHIQQLEAEVGRLTVQLTEVQQMASRAEAERAEATPGAHQARAAAGQAVLKIAAQAVEGHVTRRSASWARYTSQPLPKRRFASVTRARFVRSLLRRNVFGRALSLLTSGVFAPGDGVGVASIVRAAASGNCRWSPHPLFDADWYAMRSPDVERAGLHLLLHYLCLGDAEGRSPSPLFDPKWYRQAYGERLSGWRLTTLEHFILAGAQQGLAPNPLFDTQYYVSRAGDALPPQANPLAHYLTTGWRKGFDPHPLFANDWYLEQNLDVLRAERPPLLHFITNGATERRDPHPLFSVADYLCDNPDVAALGVNPLKHYLEQGWREGRKPCREFDPAAYLASNPDVADARIEPLTHYLTRGVAERRSWQGYEQFSGFLTTVAQELAAGMTPLEAWIRAGRPNEAAPLGSSPDPARAQINLTLSDATASQTLFRLLKQSSQRHHGETYDWQAYLGVSNAIAARRRQAIEKLHPAPAALIDLKPDEIRAQARGLAFEEQDAPEVSIVIPVFNQIKFTVECLAALSKHRHSCKTSFEVLVADDASTDDTSWLLADVKGVRLIRSEDNQGFLKNVNNAVQFARGDFLVILNNDVQVTDRWLDPIIATLRDPTVGAVSPKLLFPNGRLQEAGARLHADASAQMIGLFDDPTLPRYSYSRNVDYVSGACLGLRKSIFEKLGGFDVRFAPAYCEDADLCLRLREKGLRVCYVADSVVYHHLSVSSNASPDDFKMRQIRRNQHKLSSRWLERIQADNEVRTIALYLPQFHRVRENDAWWGAGFTEWTNVQKALPNFEGHYQPHRPAELGYYDLTNPAVMQRQSALAREYGIYGFCYYYYSFSGRRVLEAPLEAMLASGEPDFPFSLCWANENWTRTWDGGDKDVLLAQQYRPADDVTIIRDIVRYLRAPNYIRVNGKPLLSIYRPGLLPDIRRTVDTWRSVCLDEGVGEIYLTCMEVFDLARAYVDPRPMGFDASIEFPPSGMSEAINLPGAKLNPDFDGLVSDYRRIAQAYLDEPIPAYTRFRGVMPSWDNTARRQDHGFVFHHSSPGAFQAWLEAVYEQTKDQNYGDERIVFINAWNEWAEGAHLEPDRRFGRGWLEAIRNAQTSRSLLDKSKSR